MHVLVCALPLQLAYLVRYVLQGTTTTTTTTSTRSSTTPPTHRAQKGGGGGASGSAEEWQPRMQHKQQTPLIRNMCVSNLTHVYTERLSSGPDYSKIFKTNAVLNLRIRDSEKVKTLCMLTMRKDHPAHAVRFCWKWSDAECNRPKPQRDCKLHLQTILTILPCGYKQFLPGSLMLGAQHWWHLELSIFTKKTVNWLYKCNCMR